jgi:hypothetical protein
MVLPGDVSDARFRGALDVLHRGGLAVELSVAGAYSDYERYDMAFRRLDTRGLVGLSWTIGEGSWRVRLRAAVGGVWSHVFQTFGTGTVDWYAIPLEASVTLAYHMNDDWAVGVAPIATAYRYVSSEGNYAALGGSDLGVLFELRHGR